MDVVFLNSFDKNKWKNLARTFTNIINSTQVMELQNELERFSVRFDKIQRDKARTYWSFIEQWRVLAENFPLMSKLALATAVLPHTSVPVERIFSHLKEFKTNKRNKLTTKNLEAILLTYQAYGEDNQVLSQSQCSKNIK